MISLIEDAILARIKAAAESGAIAWKPKSLEVYSGQLGNDDYRRVVKTFPAVLVTFAGKPKPEQVGGGKYRHSPTFTVFVCQQNRRNGETSKKGVAGKVGTLQMLKDVSGLCVRETFGLEISKIKPGAVRSMVQTSSASIYALELHTTFDEAEHYVAASGLDNFSKFHSEWDIPPHGTIDATNDLTLETAP